MHVQVIRSMRLLPPASQYFHMSMPRWPTNDSSIAPGMAAEVGVGFLPIWSVGVYKFANILIKYGSFSVRKWLWKIHNSPLLGVSIKKVLAAHTALHVSTGTGTGSHWV